MFGEDAYEANMISKAQFALKNMHGHVILFLHLEWI